MEIGEFDIIQRYFAKIVPGEHVRVGPGDDSAVFSVPDSHELVVSTDTLIAGVHFPEDTHPKFVATRLVGANVSDLAAMGADPHACVVALTMPQANSEWLEAFAASLKQTTERQGIPLVGGNLARGQLSLTMTVMGVVPNNQAVLRSGAKAGDDIYVTGSLGDAGFGLACVQQGDTTSHCAQRFLAPEPRVNVGLGLRALATAAIDISDGFLADLTHLTESSGVGAEINLDAIPLSGALLDMAGLEQAQTLALSAGDDYELCFTAPAKLNAEIDALASELEVAITRVGKVVSASGVNVLDDRGNAIPIDQSGWQHF